MNSPKINVVAQSWVVGFASVGLSWMLVCKEYRTIVKNNVCCMKK